MSQLKRNALYRMVPALMLLLAVAVIWICVEISGQRPSDTPLSAANVAVAYAAALDVANEGDQRAAEQMLRELLKTNPAHYRSQILLGQLYWNRQDNNAFDVWGAIPPAASQAYGMACYLTGSAWLERGDDRKAESFLKEAIVTRPGDAPAISSLLDLYALQRRPAQLRSLLAARNSTSRGSGYHLALDLLAGKEVFSPQQSIAALQQFHSADGPSAATQLALATTYREMGQLRRAIEQLAAPGTGAIQDGGRSETSPLDSLAAGESIRSRINGMQLLILTELDELSQGASIAKKLIDNRDANVTGLFALGTWCLRNGQASVATEFLLAALLREPFDAAIWNLAGQAAAQSGDSMLAAECLSRAIVADDLERDAYLVLRGTNDVNLLASTMRQVSDNLQTLSQPERAMLWRKVADDLTANRDPFAPSKILSEYNAVLSHPVSNSAVVDWMKTQDIWNNRNLTAMRDIIASTADRPDPVQPDTADASALAGFSFEDAAETSGLSFQYDPGNSGTHLIVETIGGGVCVLDFDGDNRPDLFFPQGGQEALGMAIAAGGQPTFPVSTNADRLYRNRGDGSFQDVSRDAGIDGLAYSLGCAAVDLDDDGDTDIVVGTIGDTFVYRNNGDATFARETLRQNADAVTAGIGVGDFDGDGATDLWLVNYVDEWKKTCRNADHEFSTCLPATFPPLADIVLLSDNHGSYTTLSTKQVTPEQGRGLGIVTVDFNQDGRSDAYVANDGSANQLYLSDAASDDLFTESALPLGCALSDSGRAEAGMGISVADFDHDLQPDLFVTNFLRESNRLYTRMTAAYFVDASVRWGLPSLTLPVLGFGVQSGDFNDDGFADVVIANGHISDYRKQGQPYQMRPQLLANVAGQRFAKVEGVPYFEGSYLGRGVALLDYNRDKQTDVVIVHQDRNVALLKNAGPADHVLQIRLVGRQSNRDAINTVIDVVIGDTVRRQWNVGSHGFMATNERIFRFVNQQPSVDEVKTRWPSGTEHVLRGIESDSSIILLEDGRWFTDVD
jgi:tetratricopeptide (TPR) repeat protein